MEPLPEKRKKTPPIPDHWIGMRKGWETSCRSFGEALVSLTPEDLKTHALVIGATGSGKTNLLHHLIAQDLVNGHSVVVVEARGDLSLAVAELAERASVPPERVKFFDLREKTRPLGFNPLHGGGEPYYRALGVIDAVAAGSESWGPQLEEHMRNGVLLLAENGTALTKLEALFSQGAFRRALVERASPSLRTFWERYDRLSPERQAAVTSPVLNKVSALFATEPLRRLFGHQEPVDLAAQLNQPGSVTLFSLAVDETHGTGWKVGAMFLASVCREVFARVAVAESMRNPVRLYVDEFENFGMREFETILAEGRRFKLSAVLAHQTLAQLSPKMRAILLGNVGAKAVFRAGRADAEVLNKDLTGDPRAFDLASLPTGEAVLWRRGEAPVHVEVNAPLIADVGRASAAATEYRKRLRDLAPAYVEEFYVPPDGEAPSEDPKGKPRRKERGDSLEDWL